MTQLGQLSQNIFYTIYKVVVIECQTYSLQSICEVFIPSQPKNTRFLINCCIWEKFYKAWTNSPKIWDKLQCGQIIEFSANWAKICGIFARYSAKKLICEIFTINLLNKSGNFHVLTDKTETFAEIEELFFLSFRNFIIFIRQSWQIVPNC